MTCDKVAPYLTAYAAGELTPSTSAWVRSHVDRCDACGALVVRHERIASSLRAVGAESMDAPADLLPSVMTAIHRREQIAKRRMLPVPPVPPAELARVPGEVARVLHENREAIMSTASTAAVAAGAAWLAWRALKSVRSRPGARPV